MPELPEVESFKIYMDKTSLNKTIESVDVKSPEILQNIDKHELKNRLEKHKFQYTKRHGKYLFAHLDNNYWMVLHFGMTGKFIYFKNADEIPLYDRILIEFEDKSFLAFDDPRKFGKISLVHKTADFIKKKRLGPDACEIELKSFQDIIKSRKGAIKTLLMNQNILAGIGNIYSDEILFQACVHPKTPASKLNDEQIGNIYKIMKNVLKTALDRQIANQELPESFLIPNRVKNGKCPNSDIKLKTMKISGRTAYYCPECQKEKF